MDALIALVRKDLILYFSDRRALLVTLAAPILIAGFFGAVLGGAPKKPSLVPVAVVDMDSSYVSKAIVTAMRADTSFELREVGDAEATALVRGGKVRAAAVIPKGFGDAAPGAMFRPNASKPEITVRYDPSQAMALPLVKGLMTEHVMSAVSKAAFEGAGSTKLLTDARKDVTAGGLEEGERRDLLSLLDSVERVQQRQAAGSRTGSRATGGISMPFTMGEAEISGGAGRRYNGYAHAFAGMGVQFILFMGIEIGVGLLLMRRMGMWKRLRAAPLSRGQLLGSRIVSGTLIAMALLVCIYAAAILVFGVRIEGSLAGFIGVAIAFAILTSTFGLLIAALGKTPEATRGLAIVATLVLVMLGGAWVPTFVFPEWLQKATLVVPTRWAIDGLEAMTWRGLGFEEALAPIAAMLAVSALFGWLSMKRFAWEE